MLESVRKRKGHWESFDDSDGLGMNAGVFWKIERGRSGGTGLGSSISYNIVKAHGGDLNFTSEQGKGTKIILTLPVNHNAEEVIP